MPLKIDDFLRLVLRIKTQRDPEEAFRIYQEEYLSFSLYVCRKLVEESGVKISEEAINTVVSEVRRRFFNEVWDVRFIRERTIVYPPEVQYVYVLAFGTRQPLMQWRAVPKEEKAKKLREACSLLASCINVAFRGCGKILMVDIDLDYTHPQYKKLAEELAQILHRLDVPWCRSWHGGFNIFIPVDPDAHPKGLKAELRASLIDLSGTSTTIAGTHVHTIPIKVLLGARAAPAREVNVIGAVEIRLDGIYTWPDQAWLWWEVDLCRIGEIAKKVKIIDKARLVCKKVPDTHPPSVNWFRHGIPQTVTDPEQKLRQILNMILNVVDGFFAVTGGLAKKFNGKGIHVLHVRPIESLELRLAPRQKSVEEEAREGAEDGFREYLFGADVPYDGGDVCLVGPRFRHVRDLTTVFKAETGEEMLKITQLLAKKGILPECVRYFVLEPPPSNVRKFDLNIVAWFLCRHLFPLFFYPNEVHDRDKWRGRVKPFVMRASLVKNRNLVWYYYEKFNSVGRPVSDVFLREAHASLLVSGLCQSCKYFPICANPDVPPSAKLVEVANMIAHEAYRDRELFTWLNPAVRDRILCGKKPLPRLLDESWIVTRLVSAV